MKRLALTLVLLAALQAAAGAQTAGAQAQGAPTQNAQAQNIDEEKRRDIIRLLDMTKATDVATQVLRQMMDGVGGSLSMLPEEQRAKVVKALEEEMLKDFSREKVIENFVPIYDRYLTAEDIKGLVSFYETPLGRKVIETMPAIMREATEDGMRRGREAGQRALWRIASEGLLDPPAPKPVAKPKPKPRGRRGR